MSTKDRQLLETAFCASFVLLLFLTGPKLAGQQISKPNAIQQKAMDEEAKRQSLQAQAKRILTAEMAREKARDCPQAQTTSDFNLCYENQVSVTDQDLKSYEGIIRELLAPSQTPEQPTAETPGFEGPALTPAQFVAEFDLVEQSWRQYRQTACTAAFHEFEGGTGGASFQMECQLKLTRDHLRELEMIYGEDLLL